MAKSFLSVKAETEAAAEALEGTAAQFPRIKRRVLSLAAQGTRKKINAAIRITTKRRTGELLKAYRYKVHKDGDQVNIFPKGQGTKSRIFPKVYTLNYGSSKTRHKARGFIQQGELYAQSDDWMGAVNKLVQKELDKYWGE